jgi:hypothetical protein
MKTHVLDWCVTYNIGCIIFQFSFPIKLFITNLGRIFQHCTWILMKKKINEVILLLQRFGAGCAHLDGIWRMKLDWLLP